MTETLPIVLCVVDMVLCLMLLWRLGRASDQALPTSIVTTSAENPETVDAEVARLLASGQKMPAIKRVRELTGLGLKDAKEYVDQLTAGQPLTVLPSRNTTICRRWNVQYDRFCSKEG